MEKLLKALLKALAFSDVVGDVKHIERNINCAPVCCGKPMEYRGEHLGHRLNTQVYQCETCKQLALLHKHDWEK